MDLILRPYQAADKQACLDLFRGNIPHFFAPHEEAEFTDFLEHEIKDCDYFVLEGDRKPLGCGGTYSVGSVAGLCWGLVDHARHRRGLGSFLLRGRLERLYNHHPGVEEVRLDTSQHSQGFFARFGFVTTTITRDGYAPGLDRYDMKLTRAALAKAVTP